MLTVNAIVYVIFLLVIVHRAAINRIGYNEDIITIDDSLALRGIAACGIMFSHYVVALQNMGLTVGPAKYYGPVGGMGVCIFFFVSGYGLYASSQKKQPTIDFVRSRISKVYLPYVTMRLIFGCLPNTGWYSLLDKSVPIRLKLGYVLGVIEPHWFINIIMLLYLLFFISWKFSKKPILTMFILTGLASAALYFLGF